MSLSLDANVHPFAWKFRKSVDWDLLETPFCCSTGLYPQGLELTPRILKAYLIGIFGQNIHQEYSSPTLSMCKTSNKHGQRKTLTSAVSDSSPEAAMRFTGPAAHMMAFTMSMRLSALRNLLSEKSSSRRHASMQAAVF